MKKSLIPLLSLFLVISGCEQNPNSTRSPDEQYAMGWAKGVDAFCYHNLPDDEFLKLMVNDEGFKAGWKEALTVHLELYKKGYDDAVNGKQPESPLDHNNYMKGYAKGLGA